MYFLRQPTSVTSHLFLTEQLTSSPVSICGVFGMITQKLLHRFPSNSDGGSVSAQNKTSITSGADPDETKDPGIHAR